ncbi:MAG: TetR/AcrR family transcriptional regulator [Pseudomonadota bacterium]
MTQVEPRPAATRDPKRTKAAILAAAREVFARRGFDGARIDSIAAASGVNKRMIYYYFTDKEGLFLAVLEAVYTELSRSAEALDLSADPEEALARYVELTFAYYVANPHTIAILNNENLYEARHLRGSTVLPELKRPYVDKLNHVLRAGAERGVFRAELDTVTVHITVIALVYLFVGNNATLSVYFERDLATEAAHAAWLEHIEGCVLALVRAPA